MTTVTLDALDAVELTEILEYFLEQLDVLADHDLATLLFNHAAHTTSTTSKPTLSGSSTG